MTDFCAQINLNTSITTSIGYRFFLYGDERNEKLKLYLGYKECLQMWVLVCKFR